MGIFDPQKNDGPSRIKHYAASKPRVDSLRKLALPEALEICWLGCL